MGNRSKGVRSESRNVGARCPERNSFAEDQSLKSSPALRSGFCSPAIANEPKATIGVSLSSSRRLRALNLRGSLREHMGLNPRNTNNISKIPEPEKCYVETEKLPSPSLPARTLKSAAEPLLALLREATAGMT